MIFITAFLTGLLGSLHCMGMCGPIALALPQIGETNKEKIAGRLIYHTGRITTYASLGLLFGLFGLGLKLAGLQQSISIGAGVIIIIMVLLNTQSIEQWVAKIIGKHNSRWMGKLIAHKTYSAHFLMGMVNGLLPCGFVYIALIGSAAAQGMLQGAAFMALFGLGTLPTLLSVSMLIPMLHVQRRAMIRKVLPYAAFCIGCLFILRGLNLGIPLLSPKVSTEHTMVKDCCKTDSGH
jgi:sulfite exporter TauE/SafE